MNAQEIIEYIRTSEKKTPVKVYVWEKEPVESGELVKLAQQELEWKKSTTYTVLKRLCQRGLFQNTDGVVTSIISRAEYYALQSEKFVEDTFEGSLPAFLAAFTARKKLSEKEIAELQALIDASRR